MTGGRTDRNRLVHLAPARRHNRLNTPRAKQLMHFNMALQTPQPQPPQPRPTIEAFTRPVILLQFQV